MKMTLGHLDKEMEEYHKRKDPNYLKSHLEDEIAMSDDESAPEEG